MNRESKARIKAVMAPWRDWTSATGKGLPGLGGVSARAKAAISPCLRRKGVRGPRKTKELGVENSGGSKEETSRSSKEGFRERREASWPGRNQERQASNTSETGTGAPSRKGYFASLFRTSMTFWVRSLSFFQNTTAPAARSKTMS